MLICGIIVIAIVCIIDRVARECNMDCHDVTKIDNQKLISDEINGVSLSERQRRYGNGYYDK